MFTKNYYNTIMAMMTGEESMKVKDMKGNMCNTSGNSANGYTIKFYKSSGATNDMPYIGNLRKNTSDYNQGIIIGTGNSQATIDDYCMSGNIINTFNYSVAIDYVKNDNEMVITAIYTITNTGSESFTIGEIGMYSINKLSSNNTNRILFERTALDSPITIEAGGVGQLTYTITVPYYPLEAEPTT